MNPEDRSQLEQSLADGQERNHERPAVGRGGFEAGATVEGCCLVVDRVDEDGWFMAIQAADDAITARCSAFADDRVRPQPARPTRDRLGDTVLGARAPRGSGWLSHIAPVTSSGVRRIWAEGAGDSEPA